MPDWKKPMGQTYEFYTVDPASWGDKARLTFVSDCTIDLDSDTDTLGTACLELAEPIDECYVRVYLVTSQNGVTERFPLGTFLVQAPASNFNGKVTTYSADAHSPLVELKENQPPLGYSLPKLETNIMDAAYSLTREHVRAPVISTSCDENLQVDFVADTDDTWMTFIKALMKNAKYSYSLDEMGRILFTPDQDTASLQPVYTYSDDDESILYADVSVDRDLFDIPNVVEVTYSKDNIVLKARVVNDDPNSPTSTVRRGREILHRDTSPAIDGTPTQETLQQYATQLLQELSTLEYTISYKHAYCGTRVGDCIRLNYKRAGITGIKAKIVSQSIKCTQGTPVSERAVFSQKLWG